MQSNEYYPNLDLDEFRIRAQVWATNWPIIKRVTLFRKLNRIDHAVYLLHVVLKEKDEYEKERTERVLMSPFRYAERDFYERAWDNQYLYEEFQRLYHDPNIYDSRHWSVSLSWAWEPEPEPGLEVMEGSQYALFGITRQHSPDIDAFVRNLRVVRENNNEITIQLPGKKVTTYTCQTMGFRDHHTKRMEDASSPA